MKKLGKVLVLAMVIAMLLPNVAMAGNGNGGGKGGKGGNSELDVTPVNFEDGGSFPLGESIELAASNNICNITVKDKNLECITVTDVDGGEVGHEVVLYDDQLEKERKTDITINISDAVEGATYKITFAPEFMAKNGKAIGTEKVFTVTTSADAVAKKPATEEVVKEPATEEVVESSTETITDEATTDTPIVTTMAVIGGVAVIVIIGAVIVIKKKKKA